MGVHLLVYYIKTPAMLVFHVSSTAMISIRYNKTPVKLSDSGVKEKHKKKYILMYQR